LLDIHVYWNTRILPMHEPINVKSPNNISKWQIGFNSAFKGLNLVNLQTVTIPEAACIQLRRRTPKDEQGNVRNI
jgi:hypothetical protein